MLEGKKTRQRGVRKPRAGGWQKGLGRHSKGYKGTGGRGSTDNGGRRSFDEADAAGQGWTRLEAADGRKEARAQAVLGPGETLLRPEARPKRTDTGRGDNYSSNTQGGRIPTPPPTTRDRRQSRRSFYKEVTLTMNRRLRAGEGERSGQEVIHVNKKTGRHWR